MTSKDTVVKNEENFKKIGVNTKSKAFKRYHDAGLLKVIDEPYALEVREYWEKHYNRKVDPLFHLAFLNHTGKKDPRLVPSREMWNEILPYFNDMNIRVGYSDKNIYDQLINPTNSAENVLKCVRGHYFDSANNNLDATDAYKELLNYKNDLIIKPSDADNGKSIAKLEYRKGDLYLKKDKVTIPYLEEIYGFNFIVQKVIKQHPIMATPHPASVNGLRMVTFRWKNEIHHLLTYARFGGNNNVKDHAISGGVSVGVTDSGELMNFAIDTNCIVHTHHPTTNYSFSNKAKIPNYENFISFVIEHHKKILHHDYVSWDIAVGIDGQPVFIEANFRGTTWRYQLVSQKPLFGELTEEVLQYVSSELKRNKFNRNVKFSSPKLRAQNRELKRIKRETKSQIQALKLSLNNKNIELKNIKNEYRKIKLSRSWRYTSPLRKFGKIIKNNRQ